MSGGPPTSCQTPTTMTSCQLPVTVHSMTFNDVGSQSPAGKDVLGGSAMRRAWGNGATAGLSVCHGRRPSPYSVGQDQRRLQSWAREESDMGLE